MTVGEAPQHAADPSVAGAAKAAIPDQAALVTELLRPRFCEPYNLKLTLPALRRPQRLMPRSLTRN